MPLYNQPSYLNQQPKQPKKPIEKLQISYPETHKYGYKTTAEQLKSIQIDDIEDTTIFTSETPIVASEMVTSLETYLGKYDEYEYTARTFAESILAYHNEPGYEKFFLNEIMPHIKTAADVNILYATIKQINDPQNSGYNKLLTAYLQETSIVWEVQVDRNNKPVVVGELLTKAFEDYFLKIVK